MVATIGASSSRQDGRKARPILTLRKVGQALQECAQVATNEQPQLSSIPDESQVFEAALWAARNEWDINRRRGGLFGRRIGRDEADKLLANLIAGLAEGGSL